MIRMILTLGMIETSSNCHKVCHTKNESSIMTSQCHVPLLFVTFTLSPPVATLFMPFGTGPQFKPPAQLKPQLLQFSNFAA